MRMAIAFVVIALGPVWAIAATPEKFYYVGEAKLSSATGRAMGSQVLLVEKIHDRDKSTILERAIVVHPDGKVEDRTMRLAVKDDNTFTLTDEAKKVEGKGKLFGPAWKWTYFKATYKVGDVVEIEDENFLLDGSFGIARQKIKWKDKDPTYRDLALKEITPKTYEILRAALMKK